ncbi:hypothetical protein AQV86_01165 [Nanohaloarchaea archaeon SG9]|nr:hypothetical protein AQV86_01165 [Nanohaloarchaea archaeon SG9]
MKECKFCGEKFESGKDLHLHWEEKHEDELNSHQKEKTKKAKREKEQKEEINRSRRRNLLLKGLTGVTLIIFVALVLPQVMSMFQSSPFELYRQPMLGDENASVTVVEFGDYQCPHCKTFDSEIKPKLKNEYIDSGDVKFYYINLPVIDETSGLAARAGEYIWENDRDNFWDFHSKLYGTETRLNQGIIVNTATETTNLTAEEIREGLDSQSTANELQADQRIANGNGVTSTPTVYVNGQQVGNDYQSIKTAIENNLKNGN